jgi:hypothetical protein
MGFGKVCGPMKKRLLSVLGVGSKISVDPCCRPVPAGRLGSVALRVAKRVLFNQQPVVEFGL